ncbi:MAG TPA: Ku protein [Candidatus Krumholzibacteria bacterium]|nr:Ku protein [Candidatus Krumholzibacteria bacterium]
MAALRSIWKGHLRFSLVTIPVRVYNAVDTAETIHFNQIHRDDNGRVGYDKRCKKCDQILEMSDIVKGYEYEPDMYVIFEKDDLDKLKLKSTKVIDIEGFVDETEIDPALYDAPYYLGPDGDVASKTYSLLSAALKDSGKFGVGKLVLRDREDIVLVAPKAEGLVIYKLRYPKEIRKISDVPLVERHTANKEELKLAKNLIDSMSTSLAKMTLENKYADAVKEMVEAKVAGEEIVAIEEPKDTEVVDIMTALKQSIEKTKKKPMEKVSADKASAKEEAGESKKSRTKAKTTAKTKSKAKARKTA